MHVYTHTLQQEFSQNKNKKKSECVTISYGMYYFMLFIIF